MNREEVYLDQYTYEHLPQAIALLDSDEWLQLFHPPVYPSEHEEIQKLRLAVSTVLTALSALRSPWVKTSDRLPTEEDADDEGKVTALITGALTGKLLSLSLYYESVTAESADYFLPMPKLPEVEG